MELCVSFSFDENIYVIYKVIYNCDNRYKTGFVFTSNIYLNTFGLTHSSISLPLCATATRCTQREQNARLDVTSLTSVIKYCKEDNKLKCGYL